MKVIYSSLVTITALLLPTTVLSQCQHILDYSADWETSLPISAGCFRSTHNESWGWYCTQEYEDQNYGENGAMVQVWFPAPDCPGGFEGDEWYPVHDGVYPCEDYDCQCAANLDPCPFMSFRQYEVVFVPDFGCDLTQWTETRYAVDLCLQGTRFTGAKQYSCVEEGEVNGWQRSLFENNKTCEGPITQTVGPKTESVRCAETKCGGTVKSRAQPKGDSGPDSGVVIGSIVAVLVLLIICVGGFMFMRNKNKYKKGRYDFADGADREDLRHDDVDDLHTSVMATPYETNARL